MDPRRLRALSEKDGWSAAGTLRASGKGQVKLQADFSSVGSGQFTVQFNVNIPIVPPTAPSYNENPIFVEALLTWIVEGNSVTRRISVSNGTSITGSGQAVTVVIYDNTKVLYPTTPNTQDYQVSCQVVPGVRPNTEVAPVLYPLDDILYNGNPAEPGFLQTTPVSTGHYLYVPIPQDAGITSCLVTAIKRWPIGTGGTPVSIAEDTAIVIVSLGGTHILSEYDCKTPFWYPLLASAQGLYLQNSTPASPPIQYYFTAAFGIDG